MDKINEDRVGTILLEAAEQCERLHLPELLPVQKLQTAVGAFDGDIYWAAEHVGGKFGEHQVKSGSAVLIGPEGGFSEKERAFLSAQSKVVPVGLGSYILRAETAVVAVLSRFFDHIK